MTDEQFDKLVEIQEGLSGEWFSSCGRDDDKIEEWLFKLEYLIAEI